MSKIHRRLLRIVIIGSCLLGLAGTGALAGGLTMGSNPSSATTNSIWNIHATWQRELDAAGRPCWPVLGKTTITEPLMDRGWSTKYGWGPTLGTPRAAVPAVWNDTLQWFPSVPAPDGFIGFPLPQDASVNFFNLTGEDYQQPGYASIQPDPEYVPLETSGDPGFDHAVDFVSEESIPRSGKALEVGLPYLNDPDPALHPDYSLPQMACVAAPERPLVPGAPVACSFVDAGDTITAAAHGLVTGNLVTFLTFSSVVVPGTPDVTGIVANMPYYVIKTSADTFKVASTAALAAAGTAIDLIGNGTGTYQGKDIPRRQATPAVIVTSRVPLLLAGVWSYPGKIRRHARIISAAEVFPPDPITGNGGWPQYNIIEVLETPATLASVTSFSVSYYTPGQDYAVTQQGPLPMPYTVYQIPVTKGADGVPYLPINDGILKLDPYFMDPNNPGHLTVNLDAATRQAQSPVLGVYRTEDLDGRPVFNPDGTDGGGGNYFDATYVNVPLPALPLRYEAPDAPGSMHPTFGKLFLSYSPDPLVLPTPDTTPGTVYYVKVSTNAVDHVWKDPAGGDGNELYKDDGTLGLVNGKVIGYCAKSGVIRLAKPADKPDLVVIGKDADGVDRSTYVTGQQLWIQYRKLSNTTFTVGRTGKVGLVDHLTGIAPANAPFVDTFTSVDAQPEVPTGKFVIDTKTLPVGTYAAGVTYWPIFPMVNSGGGLDTNGVVWYKDTIPMHAIGGSPDVTYGVSVSAGLKMYNPQQWPDADVTLNQPRLNNKLIYDERAWPMYYDSALTGSEAPPATRRLFSVGYGVKDRKLLTYPPPPTDNAINVTVHSGSTALHVYSDSSYMPADPDVDPLAIEPLEEANPSFPDDGSGSTQFVFRVQYVRNDSVGVLPPKAWMRPQADAWGVGYSSGVVLYLDENGTGDYKPLFMQPDYESNGMGANVFTYRVIPHHDIRLVGGASTWPPWAFQKGSQAGQTVDNDLYQSLKMGVYHYFFGTSSDSLRFTDINGALNTFAFENQYAGRMNPLSSTSQTGLAEWGQIPVPPSYLNGTPYYSTGLDPSAPRAVTGYPLVDRAAGRRYSTTGQTIGDTSLYVNRTCRAPGLFEGTYKYPYACEVHPRVSCELHMPAYDDFQKSYDHVDYGEGRFFGSLFPFRSAMNPTHPGVRGGGGNHFLAETSGSYSTDTNLFRILYKQLDNKAPIEIKLWVNNASEKSPADAAHAYTSYTMTRRPDQTNPNYYDGVWYEYKLQSVSAQLPYGPHTYYFTANDGEHTARWPVRPDHYQYTTPQDEYTGLPNPYTWNPVDSWVPTDSFAYERRNTDPLRPYYDNDYVPGPFVNHAPQITNVSVTPSAGKQGTPFVFKATYTDADGQRPYSTNIIIQVSDGAPPRTFAMKPDPKYNIDPIADNSALYKAGVDYILDSATIADFALDKGVRKFYIEFTDDWGRQDDVNDRRIGELARYPSGEGNWVQGPVISGNTPPTLSSGHVDAMDNTSNSATVWSFKVIYRDIDRDAPALIKVFIGRLQPQDITTPTPAPSNKVHNTVIWDAGHTMLPTNPSDTVYSHGVEYAYQSRLAGPDTAAPQMVTRQLAIASPASQIDPDPGRTGDIIRVWKVYTSANPNTNYYSYTGSTPPDYVGGMITLNGTIPAGQIWIKYERRPAVQYYYAYEAYDGVDYATYKSSSDANLRSDSAGCFILQDAQLQDPPTDPKLHYKIRPKIVKPLTMAVATSALDPDPQRMGDIVRIWGVYTNEDLTGINYYPVPSGQTVPADYDNATHPTIMLTGSIPAGKIWLLTEADTPLVGPMPIQQPAPAGVIPDPEVFVNFTQNGMQQLITDQKNGYIDEFTGLVDRAIVFMGGQAALDGRPSKEYVAPDVPGDIASVEGVYWLSNPDLSHQYDNYYDPAKLVPPVVRVGTVDNDIPIYLHLVDPEEVHKVLGVYANEGLTGTNYYGGDRTILKWQPASIIGDNVIWPSRPNDIASIQGVFMSMNVNDAAGNFWTPDTNTANAIHVVPATVDLATGVLTIVPAYNYGGAIKAILRVNQSADMSGENFYRADPPAPYDPTVPLVLNPIPLSATVYVRYVPAEGFGPDHEFMALRKTLPTPRTATSVYIAYYPPGNLNALGLVDLTMLPPQANMFVKIWAKGFNPGDQYIKLTTVLPDVPATGTVDNSGLVRPDPNKLADIGTVTGVFVGGDTTNYYEGTANPFKIGDTDIHLARAIPDPLPATVTVNYLPRERDITVKYSDMRFTHAFSGNARQISSFRYDPIMNRMSSVSMVTGTTHFVPDGISANNINITGNAPIVSLDPQVPDIIRDIDAGIVGIWQYPEFTGLNFFNPRRTSLYADNAHQMRLSTETPVGTGRLYARAYQKGVYFLDRWNRDLRFDSSKVLTDLDRVQVSYFFGTRMAQVLVPNTLPALSNGMVTPISGSRNAQYVYSVKYRDGDGPTGQMPTYVRVYIDGVAHDMAPANQGTPDYKAGAIFTFTPTGGLSGKPHTFYFEASDGAAVAWFDKTGAHNSDRTISVEDIVEIDGPWVNDPPALLNGLVSPNPTGPGAGIGTTDSVDYRVTLVDMDNDPPYDWDPLRDIIGQDVAGSPRVWVDAGLSDDTNPPVVYTIVGLESDPSEIIKMRVIKAAIDDGAGHFIDPNWTSDQFAGKLLQISNGKTWSDISPSPYTSVYLIQSNTSNKLLIAIDDLVNDKLYPVPPDPTTGAARYAQFRVNGLLMSKTDPNQADNWAVGVDYKVTVPRLQVGTHKFHFTARTREDKPDWLLNTPGYTNTAPYSIMVRFPSLGDADGPTVISKPDDNNVAPVLTQLPTAPSRTLYRGPQAQAATVTSPTRALPTDYNKLFTILGVYRNANFDAHLSSGAVLPADQPKDFFDLGNMPANPPATGDPVKLTPSLYPVPDTMVLVQRSSKVENARTVLPDVPSAIGTVLAVYLTSDPTLLHPYSVTSSALGVGNKITLSTALPAGTTDVFITYRPKAASMTLTANGTATLALPSPNGIAYVKGVYLASDAGKTTNLINPASWVPGNASVAYTGTVPTDGASVVVDYVPWPPIYLKYYAVEPAGSPSGHPALHGTFMAGEPLTFAIFYKDANGDRPTYHDGVQGYVKLFFNDLPGRTAQLSALAPPVDYKVGVPYGVTLTDVPPGRHTYHFEASDGYVVTRYPIDQTGTAPLDEKVQVNNKPVLSNGSVDHSSGATTFTFSVVYTDLDNAAPAAGGFVKVVVTNRADSSKTATIDMIVDPSPNYFAGARYTGLLDVIARSLPVGTYDAVFSANDGIQDADQLGGTSITVRPPDSNHHPFITDYAVYKLLPGGALGSGAGKTTDTFVYRARYKDSYDDAPVATFGGVRQTALSLIIDRDTAHPLPMTMVPMTGTPDYTGVDTARWPWWETRVSGKTLKGGNHNYTVTASDGTVAAVFDTGVPSIKYGPILMIPYFALQVVGKDGSIITGQAIVGQEVLIRGQMYFPYTQADQKPTDFTNIVIQVTKPDGTVVSLAGSLIVRDYDAVNSPDNWIGDITVEYSGYVDPALATGSSLTLVASGQWIIDASWVGDATYDGAKTDLVFDSRNDQVRVTVSGPSRTVATANPLMPETTAPLVDMITPPMMIGSSSPSSIFGPDRALTMQIVKWSPGIGQYYRYDVGGYFPPLRPGDAVWIKPKLGTGAPGTGYPAPEAITRASVEEGWTTLDNPLVQKADVGGSPRYLSNSYRLIKVLAQAYPLKTDAAGTVLLDSSTGLPLFKPCTISMNTGWNQFGCIFFNWKKTWQLGIVVNPGELPPPSPPGGVQEYGEVTPADPTHISRVLGVYTSATPTLDDLNYFEPGNATQPYAKGDATIHLTRPLPADVTTVHVKYEAYPKEDVGIPISELHVTHLGVRKTLADAKTAGWITDYAWRYDTVIHDYVAVSDTRVGAEKVLKAWSGYWIRAFVDCDLEIDPNTTFNGASTTTLGARGLTSTSAAAEDMIAPPPAPKD